MIEVQKIFKTALDRVRAEILPCVPSDKVRRFGEIMGLLERDIQQLITVEKRKEVTDEHRDNQQIGFG